MRKGLGTHRRALPAAAPNSGVSQTQTRRCPSERAVAGEAAAGLHTGAAVLQREPRHPHRSGAGSPGRTRWSPPGARGLDRPRGPGRRQLSLPVSLLCAPCVSLLRSGAWARAWQSDRRRLHPGSRVPGLGGPRASVGLCAPGEPGFGSREMLGTASPLPPTPHTLLFHAGPRTTALPPPFLNPPTALPPPPRGPGLEWAACAHTKHPHYPRRRCRWCGKTRSCSCTHAHTRTYTDQRKVPPPVGSTPSVPKKSLKGKLLPSDFFITPTPGAGF